MGAYDPTYAEFEAWGGTLQEGAFMQLLPQACAMVRDLEFPNEPDDATAQAHCNAVCAAISAASLNGGFAGAGFTLGSFSVSGGGYSEATQAVADAARRELAGSGLLFKGMIR
ncbi:MAG: hypothetical protein BHV62_01600 [Eggerthella sp. 51_9]|nr:MAG: hypothetical protein BHV62_01600 [Eggerthella sp. 51_9]